MGKNSQVIDTNSKEYKDMMSIIINELNDLKVSIDQDNRKQILQALTSKTENQKKVKS